MAYNSSAVLLQFEVYNPVIEPCKMTPFVYFTKTGEGLEKLSKACDILGKNHGLL